MAKKKLIHRSVDVGDKVELTKKTNDMDLMDENMYYSKIMEIQDDHLIIQAPIEAGRVIPLVIDQTYYTLVYSEKGLFRGDGQVVGREKKDRLYLIMIRLLTPMKKYQRRQFYRMYCSLGFKYQDEQEDLWQPGLILDISGGGIRFTSEEELDPSSPVHCRLNLAVNDQIEQLTLTGNLLQSTAIEPEQTVYQNRVKFDDIREEDREVIIKFIFEEERKRRKRESGM